MSHAEFMGWAEYSSRVPIGDNAVMLAAGMVCQAVLRAAGAKGVTIADCIPTFGEPEEMTAAAMEATCRAMVQG